ncbi:hypothetical protein V8D89_016230, partial [Ganoderma adspersum]
MPEFPDEYLEPLTGSIFHFVKEARELLDDEPYPEAFAQLMLSGRWKWLGPRPGSDDHPDCFGAVGEWHRTFINACQGLYPPEAPTVVGDFDSVIGITKKLPFSKAVTWHIIPLFKETLTKNVHINRTIVIGGSRRQVPLHRIPNYMMLKFDTRHQARVFLPGFYSPHQPPSIPSETFPLIYERAVLPAAKACSTELTLPWPLNYKLAERLSRDARGRLCPVSHDIPPDLIQQFATEFLTRLEALGPRFVGAFFEIEVKGVKGTTLHNPSDPDARSAALDRVLDPLVLRDIGAAELATDWFVDVALEVHEPGHCLMWSTEGHSRVIEHTLPSLDEEQAQSLTHSSKFILDPAAHLTAFAGFRLEPGRLGSSDHITYLNVYTTDKAATYQLNNGVYRRRSCTDLLPKNIDKLLEDIDKITETLSICAGDDGDTQDGAARLEARVNIAFAEETLISMSTEVIDSCIIAVPSILWWTFKFFRMVAIYRVVLSLSQSPPPVRSWVPSLMLGASCIYMFNALIYRPSDDRAEQALAEECAMWIYPTHDPADRHNRGLDLIEEPTMIPCTISRGLYFLSAIVHDSGHLRLPRARLLDRSLLARLYGFPMLADVTKALGGGSLGLSARSTANKARTANKKVTVRVTAFQSQPSFHNFDFAAQGIEAHSLMAMTGEDAAMNDANEDNTVEETLDRGFSELWLQFPSDIIQCSPNHRNRNKPAYVHLSLQERQDVTIELFRSFTLPFDSVYIRTCQDTAQWKKLFFDKFFPPPGTALSSTLQNFRNCTYLNAYSVALQRLKRGDIPRVRAALWEQFNQLRWLPHAESDRMWPTRPKSTSNLWTPLPATHEGPAVNVVVN